MPPSLFSERLLNWFDVHGRHDLPWQKDKTLYRVWVSEIMLQQTQVMTVLPYYARFMQRFPALTNLANATQDEVLQHWAGLGYYARGRNLHKAAQVIMRDYKGQFPKSIDAVIALPGIGASTAGAILSLALGQRHAILDGNVKRSLCRYHGITGYPGEKKVESKLWQLAEQHTPKTRNADYTQAIMDLGALLCTRSKPQCALCPHQPDCFAYQNNQCAELPYRKPKKAKPKQHRFMLLFIDEANKVLLCKRPDQGIWGGLYSLPEFSNQAQCIHWLKGFDLKTKTLQALGGDILHSFTHYDLRISPLILKTKSELLRHFISLKTPCIDDKAINVNLDKTLHYDLSTAHHIQNIALPAPILKLLERAAAHFKP